jgi:hypothetical protein
VTQRAESERSVSSPASSQRSCSRRPEASGASARHPPWPAKWIQSAPGASSTQQFIHPTIEPYLLQSFVLATARLHELQNDDGAEEDYRYAITLSPLEPKANTGFALFLARQGRAAEARAAIAKTLPLWPPDERELRRQEFERTLAEAMKSTPPAPAQHQP